MICSPPFPGSSGAGLVIIAVGLAGVFLLSYIRGLVRFSREWRRVAGLGRGRLGKGLPGRSRRELDGHQGTRTFWSNHDWLVERVLEVGKFAKSTEEMGEQMF